MKNLSKWFGYPIYISKIKNFEEITFELTDQEKELLPIIIKGLNTKKGKQHSKQPKKIAQKTRRYRSKKS